MNEIRAEKTAKPDLHLRKKAAGIFARAENHRRNGQGDKALDGYHQAISLVPEHVGYRLARARYFYSRGEDKSALHDIEHILTGHKDNLDALGLKALVLSARGLQQEAIDCYSHMLDLNPNSASIHYNRGCLYYILGQYQDCLRDFDLACAFNSGLYEAFYYRGLAHINLGLPEAALDDLIKARSLNPESRQVKDALRQLQAEYHLDISYHRKRTSTKTPKLLSLNRKKLNWFN